MSSWGTPGLNWTRAARASPARFRGTPALDLLDFPAKVAALGIHCVDLCIQHIPNIEPGYLAELRAAFESADVELYQLLIDLGEVASADPARARRQHRT